MLNTESITEPKKKQKQLEQEQNHRNRDHMEGYQQGGEGEDGRKGTGIKKDNW